MRRRKPRLFAPTSFVVAYMALGWLIYYQITGLNAEALASIEPEQAPVLEELPPEPQFTMAPIENFGSVLERPLFSPNRRPPPEDQDPQQTSGWKFDYTLKGVVIDSNVRIALFDHKGSAGIVRQAEGTELDGWLLKVVKSDSVIVVRDGQERVLELNFHSAPSQIRRADKDGDQKASATSTTE